MLTKTMSAPTRSVSLQCLQSDSYLAQKTDLIAELKMSRDITGIKKMKIERAKVEQTQEKQTYMEISKQFTATNFVEKVQYVISGQIEEIFCKSLKIWIRVIIYLILKGMKSPIRKGPPQKFSVSLKFKRGFAVNERCVSASSRLEFVISWLTLKISLLMDSSRLLVMLLMIHSNKLFDVAFS